MGAACTSGGVAQFRCRPLCWPCRRPGSLHRICSQRLRCSKRGHRPSAPRFSQHLERLGVPSAFSTPAATWLWVAAHTLASAPTCHDFVETWGQVLGRARAFGWRDEESEAGHTARRRSVPAVFAIPSLSRSTQRVSPPTSRRTPLLRGRYMLVHTVFVGRCLRRKPQGFAAAVRILAHSWLPFGPGCHSRVAPVRRFARPCPMPMVQNLLARPQLA